jgi:superfamily II DNA or RNA helicase
MQAVLSDYLWVPRAAIKPHHLQAFSYRLFDGYANESYQVDTFTEELDHYRFPRGNLRKLQQVFRDFTFDDQRVSVPFEQKLRFTGQLYDEQKELVSKWLARGYGLIQAPARSGKTVMMTALVCKLKQRTLMLAHLEDLCHQLEETIRDFTNVNELEQECGQKLVGVLDEWDDFFPIATLTTYQCLAVSAKGRRILRERRNDFGLVMADEVHRCFGPGTVVSGRAIETLQEGDRVQAYDGRQVVDATVRAVMASTVKKLLTIECESGRILAVTPNHPLWDGSRYRRADSFEAGDCLYGRAEDVRRMRQGLSAAQLEQSEQCGAMLERVRPEASGCAGQADDGAVRDVRQAGRVQGQETTSHITDGSAPRQSDLFGCVPTDASATGERRTSGKGTGVSQSVQPRACKCSNEGEQPDASRARPRGSVGQAEADGAQAHRSRRKRSAAEQAAATISRGVALADGVRGADQDYEEQRLPVMLQDRYSGPVSAGSDRGRWSQSQHASSARAGPQEGGVLAVDRVASVAVHERGSDGRLERLCPEGLVYNLTVEPHNNYFADGILVHNCKTEYYRGVVETTTAAYRCGVTATPTRKDGMHVVVADTLGPVVAVGTGEQLPVRYSWEQTGHQVKPFNNWTTLWNRLTASKARDKLIALKVVEDVQAGHFVLVTTERLKHLDALKLAIQKIDPDITVGLLSGQTKNRESFRSAAKQGEYRVVIAMSRIVELGYNIPRWSCFHNTLPMANRQNWYQRVSRIRTPMEPAFKGDDWQKPEPVARIWADEGHPAVYAYRNIVKKEMDRLGFECLNPPPKTRKTRELFGKGQT